MASPAQWSPTAYRRNRFSEMNSHRPRRRVLVNLETKKKIQVRPPGAIVYTVFVAAFVVLMFVLRNVRVGVSSVPGGVEGGVWWSGTLGIGNMDTAELGSQNLASEVVSTNKLEMGVRGQEEERPMQQMGERRKGRKPVQVEAEVDGEMHEQVEVNGEQSKVVATLEAGTGNGSSVTSNPANSTSGTQGAVSQRLTADREQSSWPMSGQEDGQGIVELGRQLNMNNRSMLNYFHMHKTGGVSTKVELMQLFESNNNREVRKKSGEKIGYLETCYEVEKPMREGVEAHWRCDFEKAKDMAREELSKVDVVMGHQYWKNGCERMFQHRDVRHFAMFRHPLARKLSFFYHFFVRDVKRDEQSVKREEVVQFLLNLQPKNDVRLRDAGPNYYASRLLSDGYEGFSNFRFESENMTRRAIERVDEFIFVGLQTQGEASGCMLRKLVRVFAHAQGVDGLDGVESLGAGKRLNSGRYPWTAREIWKSMTREERQQYKEVERVDLRIYERVREKFKRDVETWQCGARVEEERWTEDVFE